MPPYLQSGLDFDDYDAQVFTYTTPRTLLQNRLAKATQNKRKADLGLMRKSSPDMIRKHGSEFKRQGSWNESQNASPRHPVRALSECEDIRLSTSVGENMIFIDGELQTQPCCLLGRYLCLLLDHTSENSAFLRPCLYGEKHLTCQTRG